MRLMRKHALQNKKVSLYKISGYPKPIPTQNLELFSGLVGA